MEVILGVDEAGRGPLAGPVTVGVVRARAGLDLLSLFPGLNDSKKLSEKKREELFELLQEQVSAGTLACTVEFGPALQIDEEGITQAVRVCAWRGVRALLPSAPDGKVFLDGLLKAPPEYEQETIVGGDGIVPAIMLASVAAKVTRDRLMREIAKRLPAYGFERHKGYGTVAHYSAIKKFGLCDEHRRSYLKNLVA